MSLKKRSLGGDRILYKRVAYKGETICPQINRGTTAPKRDSFAGTSKNYHVSSSQTVSPEGFTPRDCAKFVLKVVRIHENL
jgi:hypothetical protein